MSWQCRPVKLRSLLFATICHFMLFPVPTCLADGEPTAMPSFDGWLELGGYKSFGEDSRGEIVGFVPLARSETTLAFGEIRGKLFEGSVTEGNFAFGRREMLRNGWNPGGWLGLDVREASVGGYHTQISAGFEMLGDSFDFRVNGYKPLQSRQNSNDSLMHTTTTVTGSTIAPTIVTDGNDLAIGSGGFVTTTVRKDRVKQSELALYGFDAEVGWRIPIEKLFAPVNRGRHELRGFAGAYWFDHEDIDKPMTGPRARLEWRIHDIFPAMAGASVSLEGEWYHDRYRHSVFEAGGRLRIPLSYANSSATNGGRKHDARFYQARRMTEALERDTDIVNRNSTKTVSRSVAASQTGVPYVEEPVLDDETFSDLAHIVFVDGTGDLQAAVNASGSNTLYVVQGGRGDLAGATLPDDVTIIGGGTTIQLRGASSGIVLNYTAPGTVARIVESGSGTALTLGGHNHVRGLEIAGGGGRSLDIAGNNGIMTIPDADGVAIISNTLSGFGGSAIEVGARSNSAKVSDNIISDVFANGIEIGPQAFFAEITGNIISNAGQGVMTGTQSDFTLVANNTIRDTDIGILNVNSKLSTTIESNTIRDASEAGLKFAIATNGGTAVTDNLFGGSMPVGVLFADGVHRISFGNGNATEPGSSVADACSLTPAVGTPGNISIGDSIEIDGSSYNNSDC